jgi:ACR3 family arsenite efflux pump ArsB
MNTASFENKWKFAALVGVVGAVLAILTAVLLGANFEEVALAVEVGIYTSLIVGGGYALGRRVGQPHSHAVATAAVAFGSLYLIAVTFRLMTEFGVRSVSEVATGIGAAIGLGVVVMLGIVALGRLGPSPS